MGVANGVPTTSMRQEPSGDDSQASDCCGADLVDIGFKVFDARAVVGPEYLLVLVGCRHWSRRQSGD